MGSHRTLYPNPSSPPPPNPAQGPASCSSHLSAMPRPSGGCHLHGIGSDQKVGIVKERHTGHLDDQHVYELDGQHKHQLPNAADLQEHGAGQQAKQHTVGEILGGESSRPQRPGPALPGPAPPPIPAGPALPASQHPSSLSPESLSVSLKSSLGIFLMMQICKDSVEEPGDRAPGWV